MSLKTMDMHWHLAACYRDKQSRVDPRTVACENTINVRMPASACVEESSHAAQQSSAKLKCISSMTGAASKVIPAGAWHGEHHPVR